MREMQDGTKGIRAGIELMSNLKHVPNFFPTPKELVERMLAEADIELGVKVLEPSAGKGDIAIPIRDQMLEAGAFGANGELQCVEINYTLAEHLTKQGLTVHRGDFLEYQKAGWDRIVMNPPFERGVDEKHIRHAYGLLADGGRVVAIACSTTGRKLEHWVCEHGGYVEELPAGTFARSDRPTNVNTCLTVLTK